MSTVKIMAVICGGLFLLLGILGFIPTIAPAGVLFAVFEAGKVHNLVHLLTGAVGIAGGFIGTQAARLYFRVLGLGYAVVAILDFLFGGPSLFGILRNNTADAWLHALIAMAALYLGFAWAEERRAGPRPGPNPGKG